MYRLRLGFDIDEVISNLLAQMKGYIKKTWNIDYDFSKAYGYDLINTKYTPDDEYNKVIGKELVRVVNDPKFQFRSKPYEGAQEVIQKLSNMGYEIYYITSRPISLSGYNYTKSWLFNWGFPCDFLYMTGHHIEKGLPANDLELDFFVEDQIKHVNSLLKYKKEWKKGIILMNKPWNVDYELINTHHAHVTRLDDWSEIGNYVKHF